MAFKFNLLLILFLSMLQANGYAQTMAKPVITETNQFIVCEYTPGIFPLVWRLPPDPFAAKSLDQSKIEDSVFAIKQALTRYPAIFLRKYLKTIYLLQELTQGGVGIGGTAWWLAGIVYIDNEDGSAKWLSEVLYHEVGHLVSSYPRSQFSTSEWEALNTPDFQYGKGGLEMVKAGQQHDDKRTNYYAQGFVSQYAKSSVEEDFAEMSEHLMSGSKEFWAAVDKYPILRKKATYAVKTYSNLDKAFTEPYFRGLSSVASEIPAGKYKPGDTILLPNGGKVITVSPFGGKPTIVNIKPGHSVLYSSGMGVIINAAPMIIPFPGGGTYQPPKGKAVSIPVGSQLLIYADDSYVIKPIEAKK